ncbi:MAG TPA: DNA polymerase IV [Burkholderiaceae bacterium]|jgi:DNA polymerase-4|nr:DNA polymerase IV [Burkholderiaceae bacterium]
MTASTPRIIAHLDMDAFFASVELLRYPELRGLAVVVGGWHRHHPVTVTDPVTGRSHRRFARLREYTGRGVATTATYEARELGVHSAMGLMKAAHLAPDAILLPADFDQYRQYSRRFKAAARQVAPRVEDRGIDEIYLDLTDEVAPRIESPEDAWWCAREVAAELKHAVRSATALTCSIGLAPNKLLAKLASELDKPDGLTVITEADIASRIWPLPVRRLNGVGPKASVRLEQLGIRTIGDLADAQTAWLVANFGASYGRWLHEASHGHDARQVQVFSEAKSISRETTFDRDLHPVRDRATLSRIFTELCVQLGHDLQLRHYVGRTVGLKLRFEDFRTVTRARTLDAPTDDARAIRLAAGSCLKRVELDRRIRLLGVRVDSLSHAGDALA